MALRSRLWSRPVVALCSHVLLTCACAAWSSAVLKRGEGDGHAAVLRHGAPAGRALMAATGCLLHLAVCLLWPSLLSPMVSAAHSPSSWSIGCAAVAVTVIARAGIIPSSPHADGIDLHVGSTRSGAVQALVTAALLLALESGFSGLRVEAARLLAVAVVLLAEQCRHAEANPRAGASAAGQRDEKRDATESEGRNETAAPADASCVDEPSSAKAHSLAHRWWMTRSAVEWLPAYVPSSVSSALLTGHVKALRSVSPSTSLPLLLSASGWLLLGGVCVGWAAYGGGSWSSATASSTASFSSALLPPLWPRAGPPSFAVLTSASPVHLRGSLMLHGRGLPGRAASGDWSATVNGASVSVLSWSARHVELSLPWPDALLSNDSRATATSSAPLIPWDDSVVTVTLRHRASRLSLRASLPVQRVVGAWERRGVLLVLCFNAPRYERLEALVPLYASLFPALVVVGPEPPSSPLAVGPIGVVCEDARGGALIYTCFAQAMLQHADYPGGYLLLHFDAALRFELLEAINRPERIGQIPAWPPAHRDRLPEWAHWGRRELDELLLQLSTEQPDAIANYRRNVGGTDIFLAGMCDTYYLPSTYRDAFTRLAQPGGPFRQHSVWLESAFPMITAMITRETAREVVNITGLWSYDQHHVAQQALNHTEGLLFFHQLPMDQPLGRAVVRDAVRMATPRFSAE